MAQAGVTKETHAHSRSFTLTEDNGSDYSINDGTGLTSNIVNTTPVTLSDTVVDISNCK